VKIYLVTFYTPDQEEGLEPYPHVLISYVNPKGWERALQVKKEEEQSEQS